jgi:6-oxo-cyclohex-1-ene-carbonyl-CoA hydrolase
MEWKDHDLPAELTSGKVRYERRPARDRDGAEVDGLHAVWITLDNPEQLNSYTTGMVKDVILAFRRASNDRAAVAAVFTGAGDRAFCTGGNTKEYAEYYAGRPGEYQQYMRLFNDMVTAILHCDLPVICRVNGMRIAGGQEIGMACDLSVASDLARFGQAGPRHGSAPDGGSTDFLPLFVGVEHAMASCALCEPWTAYQAQRFGLLHQVVPVLEIDGKVVSNPLVVTERYLDERGRIVYGEPLAGEAAQRGKERLARGKVNLRHLDRAVDALTTAFLYTMPGCVSKTVA